MGCALFASGMTIVLASAAFGSLPGAIFGLAVLVAATTWFRGEEE